MKYTLFYKIDHTIVSSNFPCKHSDLSLFHMILFESMDKLESFCCISMYFISVFAADVCN